MRLRQRILRLTCFFLLPAAAPFAAETANSPAPLPKTVAVAAFKNGLAFVLRQGEVPLSSGTGVISPIPSATLGTLWLAPATPGATLDQVIATRFNIPSVLPISSIPGILQANAGKTVTVTYQNKDFTGEIIGLQDSAPDAAGLVPVSTTPDLRPRQDYLLLKASSGLLAVPLAGISLASLPADAVLRETLDQPATALRFTIKGGAQKEKLTLGYLEHGVGWTPSYLISLDNDKTARITMQAVVTNDAEDIDNAELFFVVGVPNFAYSDTLSPMSLQQSLVDYMRNAELSAGRKQFGGIMNAIAGQQFDSLKSANEPASISLASSVSAMPGAPEEDLFLYNRSGVTLARGERASYNVFSENVACEHLYTWEIADQPHVDAYGNAIQSNPNVPDAGRIDTVWHTIRLKDSTRFPWTSAPAFVISGNKPVSQDTLPYTPKGASSSLRITVATDIRASHDERETSRQQDLTHRRGYNYDLVAIEGTLKVKNYKSGEVHLSIGKTVRGKVTSQSGQGKSVALGDGIVSDNPSTHLTWDITLKPGEERALTYSYTVWIRA